MQRLIHLCVDRKEYLPRINLKNKTITTTKRKTIIKSKIITVSLKIH
jgi:hypothetical protein